MGKAIAAVIRFSRDESHAVRLATARACGHLALAELRGVLPAGSALAPLVPVMVALVGTDQSSDVQRQMLLVGCSHTHPCCKVHISGALFWWVRWYGRSLSCHWVIDLLARMSGNHRRYGFCWSANNVRAYVYGRCCARWPRRTPMRWRRTLAPSSRHWWACCSKRRAPPSWPETAPWASCSRCTCQPRIFSQGEY